MNNASSAEEKLRYVDLKKKKIGPNSDTPGPILFD